MYYPSLIYEPRGQLSLIFGGVFFGIIIFNTPPSPGNKGAYIHIISSVSVYINKTIAGALALSVYNTYLCIIYGRVGID